MLIAPPPPPNIKPLVAVYDTECFPNYWLLKIKIVGTTTVYTFRLFAGQRFSPEDMERIGLMFRCYTMISFNGNGYDVPMITGALCGFTTEQLKSLNDRIIVERVKPWELGFPDWAFVPHDHIDVMEVAPGAGSQKQYAGRIHCKTMADLPYSPNHTLQPDEIPLVDSYCENDLSVLEALYLELKPQIRLREKLSQRYGMDLRSKSDAQLAEAVLRRRCEQAVGHRIYKPDINWDIQFSYTIPSFIRYTMPQLKQALELVRVAIFRLGASGSVEMPHQLEGLEISINKSTYKLGIGGLHSQEKRAVYKSDDYHKLQDIDVASYYPSLILNSGKYPQALGPTFSQEYGTIKVERLVAKKLQKKLEAAGDKSSDEHDDAEVGNEGGKVMINGTFGKTGSIYSILFAPEMLIQTTLTGQLSLLMLIEWHELAGIPVVSANTDGIVILCPTDKLAVSRALIEAWESVTSLEMETTEYSGIYSRDINNYFAVKSNGDVKRKGKYASAGLIEKKNPDVEICGDAVAEFLSKGTPIAQTIRTCRDIRKFVTVRKVNGGGVKLWGHGPIKGTRVVDMIDTLAANGWRKDGRKWRLGDTVCDAATAYAACFEPQRPEYLGKVVRWYYGTQSPGPIVYATNGNNVSLSEGARPCMTLPDDFPVDVDYTWYEKTADAMLRDVGYYDLRA